MIYNGDFIAINHLRDKGFFDEKGDLLLTEITGTADFEGWNGNANKLKKIGGYAYFKGWNDSLK